MGLDLSISPLREKIKNNTAGHAKDGQLLIVHVRLAF